jgi:hypothetical protein
MRGRKTMKARRYVWPLLTAVVTVSMLGALSAPATADIGVGVDIAEIVIDEVLAGGNTYSLPAVGVANTGDRTTGYEVEITYMNGQEEMAPSADWFQFDPQRFSLEAGTSRKVGISLHVPRDAPTGQYFALIEAHPVVGGGGGTTIGIAAATKLRFSVGRDVSVLTAIGDFLRDHAPHTYVGLGLIAAIVVVLLLRRFLRFRFSVQRR